MKILEDYIVPVIRVTRQGGETKLERFYGTSFFINDQGVFLSASHVMRAVEHDVSEKGGELALVMRKPGDKLSVYQGKVNAFSFADDPFDIAVGVAAHDSVSCFTFYESEKIWAWKDVFTAGYPVTAISQVDLGKARLDIRSLKGYVTRKLPPGRILPQQHPSVVEVNFPIPKGLSGAPLFIRADNWHEDRSSLFVVVGVCCGNHPAELVDFSHSEVYDDGKHFEERVTRIEEYGLAQDIAPLLDWTPACLNGTPLRQAFRYQPVGVEL